MKMKLNVFTTILLSAVALCLSSCLKDARFVDLTKVGTIVEFPNGGYVNFGSDAETSSADTIIAQYVVNIASPSAPTTATTVVLSVNDPAVVTAFDNAHTTVSYLPMPTGSYTVTPTTLTVPAGQRTAVFTVTIYKKQLDPSLSYMLPVAIKSAGSYNISGNMSTHYFHFIGNDFAGAYLHDYTRIPAAGNYVGQPATLSPVSPTQFEVMGGYYTGTIRYEVTFTKNGTGSSATYTNFNISINSDDIANILTANGLAIATGPVIVGYVPTHAYTYAEATHGLFKFNWTTASGRNITDYYYKP